MPCTANHDKDARAIYVHDPGHGWLEVRTLDFPCAVTYGTGFGYVDRFKGTVLLEEDAEMTAFMKDHPWLQRPAAEYREHGVRNLPRLPDMSTDPGDLNDPPEPPEALNVERVTEALDFLNGETP